MNREENKVQKLSRVVFVSILLFFVFLMVEMIKMNQHRK